MPALHSSPYSVLLVEDNLADIELVRERLKDSAGSSPFQLTLAHTLQEAKDHLNNSEFHIVLLDLNLPDVNGLETLKKIRELNSTVPIVVLTVTEDEPVAFDSIKLGAQDFIPKSQVNSVLLPRVLRYAIERHSLNKQRQETDNKYKMFVEGATGLAFILLDLQGNITHWNAGAKRLFQYSDEDAVHKHFSMLFPPEELQKGRPELEIRRAKKKEKGDDDNWLIRKDGTQFWASGAVTAVRDGQDNLIGFAKVVRDKTAQKEADDKLVELNRSLESRVKQRTEELRTNQERLRIMASELTITEQRERRRLASDLHDYLGQLLVVCRLKLGQGASQTDTEGLLSIIQEADTLLGQSIAYTRTLVAQLSPVALYDLGLPAALVWLGSQMEEQDLKVNVTGGKLALTLPEDVAILLYQSIRELLFNVLKHSGVQEASLTLSLHPDNFLHIEVEDHGCGFHEETFENTKTDSSKFGLFSIRERLQAIQGEMTIKSAPNEGTHILLRVPISDHSPLPPG